MKKSEISELLRLRNWSRERLAVELHVSVAAIYAWYQKGSVPDGPASVLMRLLIREARGEIQITEVEPETVPA